MTSRIGNSPIGIKGFGSTTVYGRKRVPVPPARITARLDIVEFGFVAREIFRTPQPFDRARQPVAQGYLRMPACQRENLAVVAPQPLDFAALRPNAVFIRYDLDAGAENLLDERNGIADRNFLV